jgi:methionyl-tRNA formyltransferase
VRLVSRHPWDNARINDDILSALDSRDVEYLFSFLCPVIVPGYMLQMVRKACVNIHPAPPEYPGVGSASRALYDQQSQYGVTAHLMDEKVDAGRILKVRRFPILQSDTCETLDHRARLQALGLLEEVMDHCSRREDFGDCAETWTGAAMTRKQFEKWMTVSIDASEDEVRKKVRALSHSTLLGPYVVVHGHRFGYRRPK